MIKAARREDSWYPRRDGKGREEKCPHQNVCCVSVTLGQQNASAFVERIKVVLDFDAALCKLFYILGESGSRDGLLLKS